MAVEMFDGEKALYDRDYSAGRRHVGNITVTDRRLIASVDNKRIASKTEIKISSVAGTIVGFKRSGVVAFIFGVIFALIDVALCIFINIRAENDGYSIFCSANSLQCACANIDNSRRVKNKKRFLRRNLYRL